ncbi:MAG: ABC transporter substrate-binding protein [Deltaproteobacteria bacterium]|nr:ABC transporter substrate-binding protein [Deltaproteobacteria bacterium]
MEKKSYLLVSILIISMALIVPQGALAQDPIKIGFLAPLAGSRAQMGQDMAAGWEMALKEANYKAGGRTIKFIAEDHGSPNMAVNKARKLITHDKAMPWPRSSVKPTCRSSSPAPMPMTLHSARPARP